MLKTAQSTRPVCNQPRFAKALIHARSQRRDSEHTERYVWGFVGIKTRLVINVEGVFQVMEVELFVSVIDQA